MPVIAQPLTSSIGAVVDDVQLAAIGDAEARELRATLAEYGVVVFPQQELTREQQVEATGHFGVVHGHPVPEFLFGAADPVAVVENDGDKLPQEDQQFHVDYSFSTEVPDLAVLHAEVLPPNGGDTMWSNQYAAYEALSAPIRELLDGLTALHTARTYGQPDNQAEHPAVRVHPETGRRCLYVNGQFTERFPQLSRDESDMLLTFLVRHMSHPKFTVRYRWTTGTVAIWDNRCTQHFVVNDIDDDVERVINRVTILGDLPEGNDARWPHWTMPSRVSAAAARDMIGRDVR